MDKKTKIILTLIALAAACVIGFLLYTMRQQTIESKQMLELAEMDKLEMENEYEQFAMQYNEMKTQINNDSLVAQLEMEQKRTEELLEELRRVKSAPQLCLANRLAQPHERGSDAGELEPQDAE